MEPTWKSKLVKLQAPMKWFVVTNGKRIWLTTIYIFLRGEHPQKKDKQEREEKIKVSLTSFPTIGLSLTKKCVYRNSTPIKCFLQYVPETL